MKADILTRNRSEELIPRGMIRDLFSDDSQCARLLTGQSRAVAVERITRNHYTHSVPSGKSYYMQYAEAIVVWSIPANCNVAQFLLGEPANVWELSRLWAPDGHAPNLLTQAISKTARLLVRLERPDLLVSYADPNAGHHGGVYRAASWIFHGVCDESRAYRSPSGEVIARRAFHSGARSLKKAEIAARGYAEVLVPGKLRFVRPISTAAKQKIARL